jgi:hypothetical protein
MQQETLLSLALLVQELSISCCTIFGNIASFFSCGLLELQLSLTLLQREGERDYLEQFQEDFLKIEGSVGFHFFFQILSIES